MRIDKLSFNNAQTQGMARREWLQAHSPHHLENCVELMKQGLHLRPRSTSQATVVLGAGTCTEVPLVELCRGSEEVVLADLDYAGMRRACDEQLTAVTLRRRMRLVECDVSGLVSFNLQRIMRVQRWDEAAKRGADTLFSLAADCLERCPVPDPPEIGDLGVGDYGLVVSSLVLSQLFSYPLLDILDQIQSVAPQLLGEQERHARYQQAAQDFRLRLVTSHLHFLRSLLDKGGVVVLLSDVRGFAFMVHGTDHDAKHRRYLPLVPRRFFDLVRENFEVVEERKWDWITDLPQEGRFGRGYEVYGYVLK
ncbi:hypothetical protein EI42_00444 [Thermosporothrix hazakensis]|uniref:Methyltransferase family protein n=2 Tax=Thermosporothrix TaxID=768650 RepID=A0A326UEJ8_THEHA|nr:hypothetical protein [Thermosporothrix hazakensis]PZW36271.1 hypothetical protein EI42_00444 [Thermosporothrix hazakensis]BBH88736.1 hypothetical protein KTC_34870 [Thermosporothrix sp. COM3]GCE46920.1 hypothetical protein KTH_17890 [Thermosporothrix hazakensis]